MTGLFRHLVVIWIGVKCFTVFWQLVVHILVTFCAVGYGALGQAKLGAKVLDSTTISDYTGQPWRLPAYRDETCNHPEQTPYPKLHSHKAPIYKIDMKITIYNIDR